MPILVHSRLFLHHVTTGDSLTDWESSNPYPSPLQVSEKNAAVRPEFVVSGNERQKKICYKVICKIIEKLGLGGPLCYMYILIHYGNKDFIFFIRTIWSFLLIQDFPKNGLIRIPSINFSLSPTELVWVEEWKFRPSVCPFVRLSVCPFVHPSVCPLPPLLPKWRLIWPKWRKYTLPNFLSRFQKWFQKF